INMSVISDWYRGQTILVIGGTGFMGKVLVEKLLRSCSDVNRIYVLVRPKKNLTPSARIDEMLKLPIFESHKNNPEVLKKVIAVEGDSTECALGTKKDIMTQLISEVTIVLILLLLFVWTLI
ncbi:hypothetical protein L9F63_021848, partial [Diploptera punctata]